MHPFYILSEQKPSVSTQNINCKEGKCMWIRYFPEDKRGRDGDGTTLTGLVKTFLPSTFSQGSNRCKTGEKKNLNTKRPVYYDRKKGSFWWTDSESINSDYGCLVWVFGEPLNQGTQRYHWHSCFSFLRKRDVMYSCSTRMRE